MDNKHECVAYKQDTGTSTQKQFAACLAGNQNKFSVSELVTVLRSQSPGLVQLQSPGFPGRFAPAAGPALREEGQGGAEFLASFVRSVPSFPNAAPSGMSAVQGLPQSLAQPQGKGPTDRTSHRQEQRTRQSRGGGKGKVSVPVSGSRAELLGTTAGAAGASSGG